MISAVFWGSGTNIRVRPRQECDLEWIFKMKSNPEYQKFLDAGNMAVNDNAWLNSGQLDKPELHAELKWESGAVDYMTIESCSSGAFVGSAALTGHSFQEWKAHVFIAEPYRRLHFASEVYWLLISRAFEMYSASEISMEFRPDHEASMSLARFFYHANAGSVSNDKWREGQLVFKLSRDEYLRVMDRVEDKLESATLQL